ncbi:hypothetical protein C8F04DRAFT_1315733 [Mycena alexandri]|uniref:Transposase n=1 Tax=Mycena alexandri TaxID=1745969 RepID=A0AAD6WQ32_9AGAR|nr:hypothetical protein C8F04DRAFT_1315733 [Mycena alexandri]
MAARPCPCPQCKGKIPQQLATLRNHMKGVVKTAPPSLRASTSEFTPLVSSPRSPTHSDLSTNSNDPDNHFDGIPGPSDLAIPFAAYESHQEDDCSSVLSMESLDDPVDCSSSSVWSDDDNDDLIESDTEDDGDAQILENDRNYLSRERIFAEADSDDEELDDEFLPPAFSEDRTFRNAYIHVFANATFHGATHLNSKIHLDSIHCALSSAGVAEGLDKFARTLATVERRLGINIDDSIVYFFVCPECWKRHHPSELNKPSLSSTCSRNGCSGTIYTVKRTASSAQKRTPTKIMPFFPPNIAIQRMMRRPGKYEECNHWRKAEDHGAQPPISLEQWTDETDMDAPLRDIHDGWRWRNIPAFLRREWDEGRKNLTDVPIFQSPPRFVSLPCGLLLTISIDWFQAIKGRIHSTGAVFIVINNLPREIRFLAENTFLVLLIPGEMMRVHDHEAKEQVNATLLNVAADGPARLKFSGFVSTNSDEHMCTVCDKPFSSLVDPDCYNPDNAAFCYRDEHRQLRYKFIAANTQDNDYRDQIAAKKGLSNVIHKDILLGGGMFNARPGAEETPLEIFDRFLEGLWWPADVGRVRSRMGTGGGKIKADEWRNAMLVYPVALFEAWRVGNSLPDGDAPLPKSRSKVKAKEDHTALLMNKRRKKHAARQANTEAIDYAAIEDTGTSRNYGEHYLNVLRFCTASRVIVTRAISPNDATRARTFLSEAFSSWARMNCLLTPNFHLSTHTDLFIWAFGPGYGWWVFPTERHLGRIGRFKTNGHAGGELEATMMRSWWKSIFCQDLVSQLQSLPDRTAEDDRTIDLLLQGMKGSGEEQRARGTLSSHLAAMATEAKDPADTVKLPKQSPTLDIRTKGLYSTLLLFARSIWSDRKIVSDGGHQEGTVLSSKVKSFGNVLVRGVKYGMSGHHRGKGYCYGFIKGRIPCQINYLVQISLSTGETKEVALVSRFRIPTDELAKDAIRELPWGADLGVSLWNIGTNDMEAVAMEDLCGRFAWGQITLCDALVVVFSLDHTGQEPDTLDDED